MKKILAIFLAILTVFSLTVPSFATEITPSNKSSGGGYAIAQYEIDSSYTITIPAYIQATEVDELPSALVKLAIAEDLSGDFPDAQDIQSFVDTYGITYYSTLLVYFIVASDENALSTEEIIALAQQGEETIEAYMEELYASEFGVDAEGNPITDVNDYFKFSEGITLRELATYIEYGVLDVADIPDEPEVEEPSTETEETDERVAVAEAMKAEMGETVETLVADYGITYYSAVLVWTDGTMSEDVIAMAQQGDDVIEAYIETTYGSEFGTDADGNPITDINDFFYANMGITVHEFATYLEYGVFDVADIPTEPEEPIEPEEPVEPEIPKEPEEPIYYNVTAKDVLLENNTKLNVSVSYDFTLADKRGKELPYDICTTGDVWVNNSDVILSVASGNPDEITTTQINAYVEPVLFAGTFTDTVVFNASVEFIGHIYEIGATQPEYVIAEFNEDYTEVVIYANGEESDGIMKDWERHSASEGNQLTFNSPMDLNSDTLTKVTIMDGVTTIGSDAFYYCTGISEIEIPRSVQQINEDAFYYCSNLTSVTFLSTDIIFRQYGAEYYNSSIEIYFAFKNCPIETVYGYENANFSHYVDTAFGGVGEMYVQYYDFSISEWCEKWGYTFVAI